MRRVVPLVLGVLAFALVVSAAAAAAPPKTGKSWARAQIARVTAAGLLGGGPPAAFRPDDLLTGAELEELVAGLVPEALPETPAAAAVTLATLDARLVRALGLDAAAYRFFRAARAAGLNPPRRFGSETVARLLGLRFNHPAGTDDRELQPGDPITRAEAAFSAARVLELDEWAIRSVDDASRSFALPALTDWQRRILTSAVALIGMPYVWGGLERGFDCSGFVWRVVKLQAYDGGDALAGVLRGRTTFQMSGEVPRAQRVSFVELQPADVLFFGARGPRSKPAQVDHMGLYLGGGWMIHSSRYGVALEQVDSWRRKGFAWARRPLAEAGLAGA
jgi:cell wall-associated NlpC family hydrolase